MDAQSEIEQLKKEIAILKEEIKFNKTMIKELPDQVWALDDEGNIVLCNRNLDKISAQIMQKQERDLQGLNLYEELSDFPIPFQKMIRRNDEITKSSDQLMVFEEVLKLDGNERIHLSHKRRFVDPKTKKRYLLGVAKDITGQKAQEKRMVQFVKEMKEVSKAKQTFIQNFRHDLQTPISNILGAVDLILHSPGEPDIEFFTESIHASASKLKGYVDQLEDVAVSEKTSVSVSNLPVNIKELLHNVVSSHYVLAKNKGLKLNLNIEETIPETINSDQVRLYRIISNLVSNAVKYTEDGRIDIKVFYSKSLEGDLLEIDVIDTGIGIDVSDQKAIFSPLMRINREDATPSEGQGLGLSIAKEFVEDLMGQISVTSTVGQGSQFIVMIPIDLMIKKY